MMGRTTVLPLAFGAAVAFSGCGESAAPDPAGPETPTPPTPEAPNPPGLTGLIVSNETTGGAFDPDGFTIVIDGKASATIDLNEATTLWNIADGQHTVVLSGMSSNCTAVDEASRSVTVALGSVAEARFEVVCTPPPELAAIRILFARALDWRQPASLVAINADGSGRVHLTSGAFNDHSPDVSPDGRTVAFTRDDLGRTRGLYPAIYFMSEHGSEELLIEGPAFDPDWAPDGTRLVFSGVNHWGGPIMVVQRDGRGLTRLTGQDPLLEEAWPAWSPDGSRIAFTRVKLAPSGTSDLGIWVMNADGSDARQLTPRGWMAVWSPDGRRIAYTDSPTAGSIHVINVDGSGAETLLQHTETCCVDDWSADGRFLLFSRSARGSPRKDVYLADIRTGATVRVTADGAYNQDAVFWRLR